MKRFLGLFCMTLSLVAMLDAGIVLADWQEDQAALFEQIPVKPGDRIDASNWEKIKDIIPFSVANMVKKGDFLIEIAEMEWDYSPEDDWQKVTAKNAGKYEIGDGGGIIQVATGKMPDYVEGEPFPLIDIENDENAASKIAFNAISGFFRGKKTRIEWVTDWVGRKGLERSILGNTLLRYYWGLSDGPIPNGSKLLQAEFIEVTEPYDVSGIISLAKREIAAHNPDQLYCYIPAIRRVKKLAGTTRSSPFMGTDFVADDTNGFYGKVESMNWKAIEKKIALLPMPKWAAKGPADFIKQSDGSWISPPGLSATRNGFEVEDWKGAPWAPVDFVWVPRIMYVVTANAIDPYYNYGETTYYIDPVAGFTYKIVNDKSEDYWKTLIVAKTPARWDNKVTVTSAAWYGVIDDKTDHASICNVLGSIHGNRQCRTTYDDPELKESLYLPTAMQARSK